MGDIRRPQEPDADRVFPDDEKPELEAVVEEKTPKSQDFVVVIAYRSEDGEIEEEFGKFVNDLKALYTFKQSVRAYALVETAATDVLALVEKPKESSGG